MKKILCLIAALAFLPSCATQPEYIRAPQVNADAVESLEVQAI